MPFLIRQTLIYAVPLMLGGDWNDAFGEAGVGGRGESVEDADAGQPEGEKHGRSP